MTGNALEAPQMAPETSQAPDHTHGPSDASTGLKPQAVYGINSAKKRCDLPGCDVEFEPRDRGKRDRFCCAGHKAEYWHMAAQLGDRMLTRMARGSQAKQAYELLKARAGKWTARPAVPVWRDAVRKLRDKGHVIESRRSVNADTGRPEYQYRLVENPEN